MRQLLFIIAIATLGASYSQDTEDYPDSVKVRIQELEDDIRFLKKDAAMRLSMAGFAHLISIIAVSTGPMHDPDIAIVFSINTFFGVTFDVLGITRLVQLRKSKKELKELKKKT